MRIPMPDGVELLADRLRPPGETPMPVVLIRSPYGRSGMFVSMFGPVLARQGLQVVTQSTRGTFGSGGEFSAFHQEREDGLATVAWLREQPWCDGRIAMAGASYLGWAQWAVAPYLDKPLEAMCVGVAASEFGTSIYPAGTIALDNALKWAVFTGIQERQAAGLQQLHPLLGFGRRTRAAMRSLPLRDVAVAAMGEPSRFFSEIVANAENHAFWDHIDHSAEVEAVTTPTSAVTGWYDLFISAQLQDFQRARAAGRQARITIGPWAHQDSDMHPYMLRDQLSWLRAHLLDDRAQLQRPPVRLFLQQARQWLDFDNWPPPSTPVPTFLQASGRLGSQLAESAPQSFIYDPADPTPSPGGLILIGKSHDQDNREVEARTDVLVFTGDRLERDLDLIGELTATIHVRTTSGHADVFVRLCDVDEKGISRNVTDGIVRLRPGAPAADDDGIVTAHVAVTPTAYRFRRGHRIRVQLAGGAFPRFSRNHGTDEPAATAVSTTPYRIEIFHDPAHPSQLVLPVFG
ncbi:CocE/NonD family hydrolase [Nocardia sp. NPDC051321]|uniref:CocE/NonD family hydrolase n=1 Tax=Nocardia sp. NPDC051321 TaxID=3364323 RepID=UPI0037AF2836